jgi:putative SbcD/Mre11-related phosphoesterase
MIEYLKTKVHEENLILIRGNHDTSKIGSRDFTDFYIFKDIAFVHGHKAFPEIFDKNINYIILGHIHPTITLSEKNGIKKEKYKCFLTGKFRGKKTVVLPSFFAITEGISMEDYVDHVSSIIPTKELKNFEVFVVSDSLKTLDFGKLRAL